MAHCLRTIPSVVLPWRLATVLSRGKARLRSPRHNTQSEYGIGRRFFRQRTSARSAIYMSDGLSLVSTLVIAPGPATHTLMVVVKCTSALAVTLTRNITGLLRTEAKLLPFMIAPWAAWADTDAIGMASAEDEDDADSAAEGNLSIC
jgi:hypothetical protein